MLSDIETKLEIKIREIIKTSFGKDLEKMEDMEKTEVFFIVYKSLAMTMERDFDTLIELQIVNITKDKSQEIKRDKEEPKEKL